MNVIVFASRKGGSGKSTLAAHLAAHVHKATKPCLLVDADPQGSLTLWHKLRGTNEPPIRTAVRSVGEIVAAAKRDGIEWVFIDTPANMSAPVTDAIRCATLVVVPARPGVFDIDAIGLTGPNGRSRRQQFRTKRLGPSCKIRLIEHDILDHRQLKAVRLAGWGHRIDGRTGSQYDTRSRRVRIQPRETRDVQIQTVEKANDESTDQAEFEKSAKIRIAAPGG